MNSRFPRNLAQFVCSAAYFLISIPGWAQDRPAAGLSVVDRAYIASRLYASLDNFAHWQDVQRADMEAAYRRYLDQALASDDRFAFSRASIEFLAAMHNGHTMFVDLALIQQGGWVPFEAVRSGGKWVVRASASAGLQPGDIIETVDNQTFEQFFQERRKFLSASTEQWAQRALFARLPVFAPYAHLFPARFVLGLAGARRVSIDRGAAGAAPVMATEGRWLEAGKEAYIRIPSFFSPEFEKRAVALVREFHDAAVLIVDVRGNMGGNTPRELLSLLMDRPFRGAAESTPVIMPYFRLRASQGNGYDSFGSPDLLWRSEAQQPAKDHFKGKLVLLVDAGCHSACEDLVIPFKDNGRALIAGGTTAGSAGQPYNLDLGNGMMAIIGAKRAMFPDGSRFEGVGIRPDVEVAPAAEDIRQGKDVVLETARKRVPGS